VYTQTIETETGTEIPFAAVYILADKFFMEVFKNAIVDAAIDYCEHKPVRLEGLTLLIGHNLSSSHFVGVFLNKITLDIVKRCGSRYSRDEEQPRTFSNLLGDTKVMRQFLPLLNNAIANNNYAAAKRHRDYGRCFHHEHRETLECKDEMETDSESGHQTRFSDVVRVPFFDEHGHARES
jgi:nitrogenase subunit NifH